MKNTLYYGDNLVVLRESIQDEAVDLIYLDPPFNSNATFNLLFSSKGHKSNAQIEAFEDTWHWGPQAEEEFTQILRSPNTDVAEMMQAMRSFLGENDMMAYLTMMGTRLLELHRVLKPTGSIYLHCDPTASHYLKILMDGVFGPRFFLNEIIWKRSYGHGDSKRSIGRSHDTLLLYTKSEAHTLNRFFHEHDPRYIEGFFRHEDERGRYKLENLTSPSPRPNLTYPYKGYPPPAKGWRVNPKRMAQLDHEGRLYFPKKREGRIMKKVYLADLEGQPMTDVWTDIRLLSAHDAERLGYPTQKPVALLERIIEASSNPGDLVLDPFCGCGTAVHAAQKLERQWIGIDITHLAISLVEKRLRDAFPGITFNVEGTPVDIDGARDLALRNKYQFQWWACHLVNAQPYQGKKKGADGGIDGLIFFEDEKGKSKRVLVSVKGGENVGLTMVKDLIATVQGEKAQVGLFVTLTPPTRPMIAEAARAGYYDSPLGKSYPRLQILTIAGLMDGTERPQYPLAESGGMTFKRAKVELKNTKQRELFEKARADIDDLPLSALVVDDVAPEED